MSIFVKNSQNDEKKRREIHRFEPGEVLNHNYIPKGYTYLLLIAKRETNLKKVVVIAQNNFLQYISEFQ